jgi:hypothetical protein
VRHEQECPDCEKTFVFTTFISFSYQASKADCLNGAPHRLEFSGAYPRQYSKMRCCDCDYERRATPEELAVGIGPQPASATGES